MRYKNHKLKLIIACVFALSLTSFSNVATAQDEERRGFFGIFNKSDQKSNASPLFLDKPGNTSSSAIKPYNMNKEANRRSSQRQSVNGMSTAELNELNMAESRAFRRQLGAEINKKSKLELAAYRQQIAQANDPKKKAKQTQKKFVYQPHKFQSERGEKKRNTIFNSQR